MPEPIALMSLWLPIVLSAVGAFIASTVLWMVIQWHNSDWKQLPDEDGLRKALNAAGVKGGLYMVPYCKGNKDMGSESFQAKTKEGPCGMLIMRNPGAWNMGSSLAGWFVYLLCVSLATAYVASRTLPAGADYLAVFRIAGTVAVLAYSAATFPAAIWEGRPWGHVLKNAADGAIYGLITAGFFGMLWPAAA
ncbi:MAG TPA: hypothetical protein VGC54_04925 [Planctomycetota bacterium]